MLLKLVLLLAAVFIVDAGVMVRLFNDGDAESDNLSAVQNCDLQWCEQSCERAGFSGGECVQGSCMCEFLRSKAQTARDSLTLMGSCDLESCVTKCKTSGGFDGGVCVKDNACFCYVDGGASSGLSISTTTLQSCDPNWCIAQCRKLNFNNGRCLGDACFCYKTETRLAIPLKTCESNSCRAQCQQAGFPNAFCAGDMCVCYKYKEKDLISLPSKPLATCSPSWCTSQCQQYGYRNGMCIGNLCYCINSTNDEVTNNEVLEAETTESNIINEI